MQTLSREILLRGASREGKEPQNRKQWDEVGSSSVSVVEEPRDGTEDGVEVGESRSRRATQAADIRVQSTLLCQVYRGYGSAGHIHRAICIWSETSSKQTFCLDKP